MKKENKIAMTSYIVASICFYVGALICFISETISNSIGIMNLCLGSTFLCLFTVFMNKENDKQDKNKKENK